MKDIKVLLDAEGAAVEEAEKRGEQYRSLDDVVITRGHGRTRILQIRINDDEYAALEALANQRHIPTSTAARSMLLAAMAPQPKIDEALDQIEKGVSVLRGHQLIGT